MIGWILLGAVVLFVLWVIIIFNSLISLRNNVQNAWKQIDVQLKRRHDLIPNLVSSVRGAMEFEQDTLEKVINARAKAVSSVGTRDRAGAENMLTQTLGKLFAVMENYPDLKSNVNIMQLQEELTSTENKVGFSRQLYNDLVANYRTRQEVFPNNIIASLFSGFQKEEYFEAAPAERLVPPVNINIRKRQTC
ncbi:MAG: LemA family protein [Nitrospiraceae bacterium]|nr:MAG: LemA family protein [Nitrospiraceae bacterium]